MKLNNKGVTIVELLVSLALLSVVLMLLYNLLSNVTFEKNTDFIANANQANRIDIINTIEHDLLNDNDISIDESQTKVTRLVLKGTKNYVISITENTLAYYVNNDIQNTWKIKGGKLGEINCENTLGGTTTSDNVTECKSDSYNTPIVCTDNLNALDSIKITECTIPVYTTNVDNSKENNNTLDDITFSFIK
ncbi:MAG: prepilin-type N-terminal cleavage/methylation domain-containing protein [Bacilli bacterium]|nr:prepilin-type N-terminal cleavage/methylation domain-containing protein [Bacilli bacterium]